ncbi:hypothetical protein [Streptomyces sp. TLI_55]|uniref:hypothetical protein n=1 Tax=Streptomyces sp. TLI_55 TaxID=1938861 RepID=UPI00211CC909|nr:hypothetical protein [Streptomyces sp. TLI_55]
MIRRAGPGREAAARAPRGEGDPAYWNLGIAATIQRDWATARDAWAGFGIQLPAGEGEITGRFGHACVRLDTGGEREVVWVERLCPTRGRVVNDELLLFRESELPTLEVTVAAGERADLEALVGLFTEHGYGVEPASSVRMAVCLLLERWAAGAAIGRSWSRLDRSDRRRVAAKKYPECSDRAGSFPLWRSILEVAYGTSEGARAE